MNEILSNRTFFYKSKKKLSCKEGGMSKSMFGNIISIVYDNTWPAEPGGRGEQPSAPTFLPKS